MNSKGIIRLWSAALKAGEEINLASGDKLQLLPDTDNQGSIEIGDGSKDMDVKVFLGESTDFVLCDVSAGHVQFDNAEINMGDNDEIEFGDGPDIQIQWNATYLQSGPVSGMWANCPSGINPDPNVYSEFYDDFLSFSVGNTTSPWRFTNTNGTAVLGNASDSNTPGNGFVEITTAGGDSDFGCMVLSDAVTGAGTNFATSGLRTWFEVSFMASNVTDCSYYVGMCEESVVEATVDGSGAEAIQDGIYFRTLMATPTEIDFCINQDTTETIVGENADTLVINTAIRLGWYTDGTTLTPYFDGVAGTTTLHSAGNFPSDQSLTPFIAIKAGTTAAVIIRVDYVKLVQMRA